MVFFASVQGATEAEKGFDISSPGGYNKQVFTCGVSTSVVRRLPKPNRRVRLPYPAPVRRKRHIACDDFLSKSSRAHSAAPHFPTKLCFANFRGAPGRFAACYRKCHIPCDDFFVKIIARSFCSSSLPHETLLCKLSRGPRPLRGMLLQASYRLRRLFVRSHRALFAPPPRQAAKHKRPLARVDFSNQNHRLSRWFE